MTATYPLQRRRRDFDACFANGEAFEASEELAAAMGCFPVFEDVIRIRTNRRLINGGFPMLKGAYLGRKFHRTIFVFMFVCPALMVAHELYPPFHFLAGIVGLVLMVYMAVFVGLMLYFFWRRWVKTQPEGSGRPHQGRPRPQTVLLGVAG